MISIDSLSVKAGKKVLLDNISLNLENGNVYALLGENGSGKTTLLRALTSSEHRYSGSIAFDGKELREASKRERETFHSLLPQVLPLVDITVTSLLEIYPGGKEILSTFGLEKLLAERVATLSGGEREMVFLAFSLSRDTELYAFDEPEANRDIRYRRVFEDVLPELKRKGKIVIVSFHDISRALRVADYMITLSGGKLASFESADSFLSGETALRVFDLKKHVFFSADGWEKVEFF